jgi:hypothetical protein
MLGCNGLRGCVLCIVVLVLAAGLRLGFRDSTAPAAASSPFVREATAVTVGALPLLKRPADIGDTAAAALAITFVAACAGALFLLVLSPAVDFLVLDCLSLGAA